MKEPACIQRTRAAVALTVTLGAIQKYGAAEDPHTLRLVKAIGKTAIKCFASASAKHLSQGARRDHAAACEMAAPWLEDYLQLHDDIVFFRWATVCYCALTLIEDVCNVCPAVCAKTHKKSWEILRKLMDILCAALVAEEPGIASSGCDLYECVVDAMRGEKELIPITRMSHAFVTHKATA